MTSGSATPFLLCALTGLACATGAGVESGGLSRPVTPALLRRLGGEAVLRLEEVASLPGDVVVAGGYFYGAGGPLCSALFVSRDGGRTWREAGLRYGSCGIQDLRTVGTSHVWGIVTFRQEGCRNPERVLASDDAGKTWSVTPLDVGAGGLCWTSRFAFDDPEHGLLSVSDCHRTETFATDDGGRSWRLLWSARRDGDIEVGADHPPVPAGPPTAPLFTERLGHYKVTGWIRLRSEGDAVIFEAYHLDAKALGWRERARMPRRWTVEDGRLAPRMADEADEADEAAGASAARAWARDEEAVGPASGSEDG